MIATCMHSEYRAGDEDSNEELRKRRANIALIGAGATGVELEAELRNTAKVLHIYGDEAALSTWIGEVAQPSDFPFEIRYNRQSAGLYALGVRTECGEVEIRRSARDDQYNVKRQLNQLSQPENK